MMDHNYDPYEQLQQIEHQTLKNAVELEMLSDKVAESCRLMESMAAQIKHLTNAIIGIQNINKILNHRINTLEGVEND